MGKHNRSLLKIYENQNCLFKWLNILLAAHANSQILIVALVLIVKKKKRNEKQCLFIVLIDINYPFKGSPHLCRHSRRPSPGLAGNSAFKLSTVVIFKPPRLAPTISAGRPP